MLLASLFNLAGPDLLIILLIVLLLFGAKKLPELAKGMGQAVREFNRAKDDFEKELTRPTEVAVKQPEDQQPRQLASAGPDAAAGEPVGSGVTSEKTAS
jgi:sec-independent protein translocase protein TatA